MQYYFRLQRTMLERHLTEFGLAPGLGYLLSALLFTGFSGFLFYKTIYAEYIYLLICLSYLGKLSEWERNNFLKLCFPKTAYRQIRLVENSLLALPFLFFLVMQTCWLSALALVLAAPGMAFLHFEKQRNFQLPTPFFRRPFEFIVGFRSSFWLHFLAYGLGAIALNVGKLQPGTICPGNGFYRLHELLRLSGASIFCVDTRPKSRGIFMDKIHYCNVVFRDTGGTVSPGIIVCFSRPYLGCVGNSCAWICLPARDYLG
ncbi:MAG: hypothetical protein IPL65_13330 [Lewinellaceae bacterium]|nr:hypothetical protein [Lewinellaceae bacterium]